MVSHLPSAEGAPEPPSAALVVFTQFHPHDGSDPEDHVSGGPRRHSEQSPGTSHLVDRAQGSRSSPARAATNTSTTALSRNPHPATPVQPDRQGVRAVAETRVGAPPAHGRS